ncbi:MAG: hypothetical protein DBX91_15970 [Subdoligranulum variabile]|nr:MAG: hypothetical protein DBX91_15970 [Subdoligranulum variabile]
MAAVQKAPLLGELDAPQAQTEGSVTGLQPRFPTSVGRGLDPAAGRFLLPGKFRVMGKFPPLRLLRRHLPYEGRLFLYNPPKAPLLGELAAQRPEGSYFPSCTTPAGKIAPFRRL